VTDLGAKGDTERPVGRTKGGRPPNGSEKRLYLRGEKLVGSRNVP
jgi:hypothetical protein